MTEPIIRLTRADLEAIEYETRQLAGETPTIETLTAEGLKENRWFNGALDTIASAGRVVTLLIAELIQSLAALIIAVVFAVLEYFRVMHGAAALGQANEQAALIAVAVVTANLVHPIYSLRQVRGQQQLTIVKMTGAGYLEAFWRRLTGKPITEQVDLYHNPTLHMAAAVITWSTVLLAVYDILSPLLTQLFTGTYTRPLPIMLIELVMGLGLSVAGVFFLQSAAHEIGVRTLTDQPKRLTDVLESRRAAHVDRADVIREEVRARFMAAKLAEQERKAQTVNPTIPARPGLTMSTNGNGRGGHDHTRE